MPVSGYKHLSVGLFLIILLIMLSSCVGAEPSETIPEAVLSETTVPVIPDSPTETVCDPTGESGDIDINPSTASGSDSAEVPNIETVPSDETPAVVPWYERSRLIYHAGGGVNGMTYTNSKEAIEQTLAFGDRLLEIDFLFTSDGHLVCLHEWKNLHGLMKACSLEQFLSLKIYDQFTTVTAAEIIGYMRQYPDMYLIIDTKEASLTGVVAELLRLCDADPEVVDRFVVQLYDRGMKAQCLELYPFAESNFLFTVYRFGPGRVTDILNLCQEEEIRIVTAPYGSWDKATLSRFTDAGLLVFEHTLNYTSMTDNALGRGVYGFYTDFLQEGDLKLDSDT